MNEYQNLNQPLKKGIDLFHLLNICQIIILIYYLKGLTVNIFTIYVIIQYSFIANIYLIETIPCLDPPKRVNPHTLIFAISALFIENKSRFLILFYNNNFSDIIQLYRANIIPHLLKYKRSKQVLW